MKISYYSIDFFANIVYFEYIVKNLFNLHLGKLEGYEGW